MKIAFRYIFLTLILWSFSVKAEFPMVRNFPKQKYQADTQNWDISQMTDGRMVFANKRGLLTFDGYHWGLYPLDNYGAARSLMVDSLDNRIFVGGSWTFGYFSSEDKSTDFTYHSLLPTLVTPHAHIGDVWNIIKVGNDIYLQSDYDLFRYDGEKTYNISVGEKILASGEINGNIYLALKNGKLCRLEGEKLVELAYDGDFDGRSAAAITPDPLNPTRGLLVTAFSGCYSFDRTSVRRIISDIDSFMKDAQVFCASTKGDEVAFGTVNSGVVIRNFRTGEISFIGRSSGLQNSTVLSLFFDNSNNVWLGLDNGIDYVMHDSPVKLLFPSAGQFGTGYSSCLLGNTLLFGTNQGLFSLQYPHGQSEWSERAAQNVKKQLQGQVWSIQNLGEEVAVSSDLGLFIGRPGSLREIGQMGGVWNVGIIDPSTLIVSTYDNYHLVAKTTEGWVDKGIIDGFNDANAKVKVAKDGSIWLADWQKGLYSMSIDKEGRRFFSVKHYSDHDGLPYALNLTVDIIDGRIVVGTVAGFYTVDSKSGKLVYDKALNKRLPFRGTAHIYRQPDGTLWGVDRKRIMLSAVSANGEIAPTDSSSFSFTTATIVPGFDDLNFVDDKVFVASEDGFFIFEPSKRSVSDQQTHVGLNRIILDNDSIVSAFSDVARDGRLILPHHISSVRFEAYLPEYRKENAALFSFYLEGYDKDWSPFIPVDSKEYTRLGHGDYVLHIRARNSIDGDVTEAAFEFSVATPWYWSIPAKIIYLLLLGVAVYFGYKFITRYAHKKARKVEAKKEEEITQLRQAVDETERERRTQIETLQNEQKKKEFTHLNESLENTTRNTMHRNEILLRINSRLDELKGSLPMEAAQSGSVGKKVNEVQKMIDETLQRDDTLTEVDRHFAGLYGDYVERLHEAFPDLTKMEFRLCCFIKMGLSTKEIAPLMNVAPKSVEMSRYRLRKKLGLDRDVNLAQFLQSF